MSDSKPTLAWAVFRFLAADAHQAERSQEWNCKATLSPTYHSKSRRTGTLSTLVWRDFH